MIPNDPVCHSLGHGCARGGRVATSTSASLPVTTKSLNWTATAKSLNWAHQRDTLGLSEAAASRQTTQSEGVRSVELSQEAARDPPECCLSVAGTAGVDDDDRQVNNLDATTWHYGPERSDCLTTDNPV